MADYNAGSASISIRPNLDQFANRLRTDLQSVNAEFKVDVVPDLTGFAQQLQNRLGQVHAEVDVEIRTDLTGFEQELQTRLNAMTPSITVDVDVNSLLASLEIAHLTRDRRMTIDVDVDGSALNGLRSSMSGLGGAGSSAAGGMGMLPVILGAIVTLAPSAIGAIGSIGVGMAGLGTIAGPALGALITGVQGVGTAITAAGKAAGDASEDSAAAAKKQEAALRTLGSAQQNYENALKDEERAHEDVARARKDAQEQMEDLSLTIRGAALDEQGAVLALARARADLNKLGRDGEPVSQLDRADAIQRVGEAEQRLLEVQERNNDLRGQAAEADAKGVEGSDQVTEAKDRLFDAEQRLTNAQQQVRDAQREVNEVQTQGSASADAYAEAMAKLTPAAQAFVLQMRALAAEGGAWDVFQDSVQQGLFEGIGTSITDLATNVLPKITPAMTEVARSVGQIMGTISGVLTGPAGEQLTTLLSSIPTFFTAMTPGIEATVQGFLAFGAAAAPAMESLGKGMGDVLGGIGNAFVELNKTGVLTQAIEGFGDMMSGMGSWLGPLVTMFTQLGATMGPIMGDLFESWGRSLTLLTPALDQIAGTVGQALVDVFVALEPAMPVIAQAFADMFTAVAPMIPVLADLAATVLVGMAQNFSVLMTAMTPVVTALADSLEPVIPILANHFKDLAPVMAQVAGVVGQALVEAIDQLAPYLPEIVQSFSNLLVSLAPLLPELVRLALQVIPPLTEAFIAVLPHITTVLDAFTWAANYVIPLIIPALESLDNPVRFVGDYFVNMANTVSGAWNLIVNVIKGSVKAIGNILKGMGDGLAWAPGDQGERMQALGQSMINWANDTSGTPGNAVAQSEVVRGPGADKRLQGKATGGLFRGAGGPTEDANVIAISDREYVVKASATAKHLPLLEAINNDAIPGYAEGGLVSADGLTSFARGVEGKRYDWGGVNWGDCSGAISALANFVAGWEPFGSRFATMTEDSELAKRGASPGLGPSGSLNIGWFNGGPYGGHTAATLPNGVNFEMGGARGNGQYGGQAAGATDPSFTDHAHFPPSMFLSPYTNDGVYAQPGMGGGAGGDGTFNPYAPQNPGDPYGSQMLGDGYGGSWERAGELSTTGATQEDPNISLQGYGAKAGELAANWLLGIFGLENSILSSSNTYNRALNDTLKATTPDPAQQQVDSSSYPTTYSAPVGQVTDPKLGDVLQEPTPSVPPISAGVPAAPEFNLLATPPLADGGHSGGFSKDRAKKGGAAVGAEQWRPTVEQVLTGTGRSLSAAGITVEQIDIESDGDENARGPADPIYGDPLGLLQVKRTTFEANKDARFPGGQTDPEANIAAAYNYVDDKYGGPQNIWPTVAGYAGGGWIRGAGSPISDSNLIAAADGEFMVRASAAAAGSNAAVLEAMNSGATFDAPPNIFQPAALGGNSTDRSINYGDVNLTNMDEFFARQERAATIASLGELAKWGG